MPSNILTQPIVPPVHLTHSQRKHARNTTGSSSTRHRHEKGGRTPTSPNRAFDKPLPLPPKPLKPSASTPTPTTQAKPLPGRPPTKRSASLRSLSLAHIPLFSSGKSSKAREREQLEEALRLSVTNSGSPSTSTSLAN